MNQFSRHQLPSIALPLAAALMIGMCRNGEAAERILLINVDAVETVQVARPAPTLAPVERVKPAAKDGKLKETSRLVRLTAPIWYPTIYPNPLAFNMTWVAISNKTFADIRALANRQKANVRRIRVAVQPQPNPAAQNAIQQQLRKMLEPMLKAELSFAARATDLNLAERKKLSADGKAWFEKFLVEYLKKMDPNQQQMLLQGMQGVWFGNQQQRTESPRDAVRTGIAKLVKDTLPKEKVATYSDECRKRDEFARQVAIDNLVERIDEKVKLSPDQWQKIAKTLQAHWDNSRDPQLESFALNQSMWPGAPVQWVLPELTPAQQAVLKRVNARSGQVFFNGGIFGQMLGGNVEVVDDIDVEVNVEAAQPAAAAANPEAE